MSFTSIIHFITEGFLQLQVKAAYSNSAICIVFIQDREPQGKKIHLAIFAVSTSPDTVKDCPTKLDHSRKQDILSKVCEGSPNFKSEVSDNIHKTCIAPSQDSNYFPNEDFLNKNQVFDYCQRENKLTNLTLSKSKMSTLLCLPKEVFPFSSEQIAHWGPGVGFFSARAAGFSSTSRGGHRATLRSGRQAERDFLVDLCKFMLSKQDTRQLLGRKPYLECIPATVLVLALRGIKHKSSPVITTSRE